MKTRNLILTSLVALAVAFIAVLAFQNGSVVAADEVNNKPSPMVGLAQGQTARLNIVMYGEGWNNPPPACQGELLFFDGDGSVLKRAPWTLEPNKAAFLDLEYSSLGRSDNRAEIRGVVKFVGNPGIKQCARNGLASLELFTDTLGVTTLIVTDLPIVK